MICKDHYFIQAFQFAGEETNHNHRLCIDKVNYPDKAATKSEDNIPTDPSPMPIFFRSSADASALLLNT